MKKYFITATDTDAGKTFIACAIAKNLGQHGQVKGFKPVSAGCELLNGQLINEDAALLAKYCNAQQSISDVNPIAFQEPIAPHIAAAQLGVSITTNDIQAHFEKQVDNSAQYMITEGAGGWRLPLGNGEFLSDFAKSTQQAVVLVVNMKLGCLNHARLTFESIVQDGLIVVGWVANCIEDMLYQEENLSQLNALLSAPCLGVVPKCQSIDEACSYLSIDQLI